ncbi:hypothetical protein D1AOALGA4SA_3818 [Olavius algarvensis Delta 1 endosymbiont]|nr:hypothetical protein D1AOALGA4SA_3818 [Olavius algarvensis Delta 1 endosymbiont]
MVIKADDGPTLIFDDCRQNKIDLIPPSPVFQHSIIPLPHSIPLRQSSFNGTDLA